VRVETVAPRPLAVARGASARAQLRATIIGLLDQVWPVLRAQTIKTGHNVVIYHGGLSDIEAGVEIFGELRQTDVVKLSSTPTGTAAIVTHLGEYADVGAAYTALERWCAAHGRRRTDTSWEIYGDWSDDPTERRMDVYWLLAAPGRR
jgi:effector-binding domain-containing protein